MNDRIRRLAAAMDAQGMDLLLIIDDLNLYYYLGSREQSMERLRVLAVDRQGGCTLYANALFAPPPCPVPNGCRQDAGRGWTPPGPPGICWRCRPCAPAALCATRARF